MQEKIINTCDDCRKDYEIGLNTYKFAKKWGRKKFYCSQCRVKNRRGFYFIKDE